MKALFKPATWLMCQMTYTYKFLILGAMALLTVSFRFRKVPSNKRKEASTCSVTR